ncbi:peptidylprolyl isomerase [Jiella sp. CQZ9-1]|uniref:Peptidylprolyl isomerase n=2 Tax=Jiella flava TaxID=2816857 RepID=A0A939JTC3_9HYPH|nr:peptidylprolyl isomerase [Jiella flava]
MSGLAVVAALSVALPNDLPLRPTPAAAATSIAIVVNNQPITTYQISEREAFLRLRREKGNLRKKAEDELIDDALKQQQARQLGIQIPDDAVEEAFKKFAASNKLTTAQLTQVLARAGFSAQGFKAYIHTQMSWGQAVQASLRHSEAVSEQDAVQRMLEQGGKKPKSTEYTLQQVIFVVPSDQRGALLSRRKREAEGMRSRFRSCASTYDIAKQLRDVTVRDLGRVVQPALPSMWKDAIENTPVGRTTPVKTTDRGVEFIAVCDSRQVDDDQTAAMVFQSRELAKLGKEKSGPDAKLLEKLRKSARIIRK